MDARRISPAEALPYFLYPCQMRASLMDKPEIPQDGVEYWACGGVCAVFHDTQWPRIITGHFAVKPECRGFAISPASAILSAAWDAYSPHRITGWMKKSNRSGIAFVRRLGFEIDGELPLAEPVVMLGWARKCQLD